MPTPDRPDDGGTPTARPPSTSLRHYNEQEVSLILRRAAEMQADQPGAAGTSLADLEDIALEAGLDPALVRRAASDLTTASPIVAPSRFLGAARRLHVERVIDGELSEDDLEALVGEVRRSFGEPGIVSTLGRTVTWSPTPSQSARQLFVTVFTRGGQTTIRAEENLNLLAGGLFGGLMGVLGGMLSAPVVALAGPVFHAVLPVVGAVGALVGGSYALARSAYGSVSRQREQELRTLIERLAACAERTVAP